MRPEFLAHVEAIEREVGEMGKAVGRKDGGLDIAVRIETGDFVGEFLRIVDEGVDEEGDASKTVWDFGDLEVVSTRVDT